MQLSVLPLQVPTVTGIGQDAALLYEAESEEVVVARDTFASLRQYLVTLQDEVLSPFPKPACGHSQIRCAGTRMTSTQQTHHLSSGWQSLHGPRWESSCGAAIGRAVIR